MCVLCVWVVHSGSARAVHEKFKDLRDTFSLKFCAKSLGLTGTTVRGSWGWAGVGASVATVLTTTGVVSAMCVHQRAAGPFAFGDSSATRKALKKYENYRVRVMHATPKAAKRVKPRHDFNEEQFRVAEFVAPWFARPLSFVSLLVCIRVCVCNSTANVRTPHVLSSECVRVAFFLCWCDVCHAWDLCVVVWVLLFRLARAVAFRNRSNSVVDDLDLLAELRRADTVASMKHPRVGAGGRYSVDDSTLDPLDNSDDEGDAASSTGFATANYFGKVRECVGPQPQLQLD